MGASPLPPKKRGRSIRGKKEAIDKNAAQVTTGRSIWRVIKPLGRCLSPASRLRIATVQADESVEEARVLRFGELQEVDYPLKVCHK